MIESVFSPYKSLLRPSKNLVSKNYVNVRQMYARIIADKISFVKLHPWSVAPRKFFLPWQALL